MPPTPYHRAYRRLSVEEVTVGWRMLVPLGVAVAIALAAPFLMRAHAHLVAGLLQWLAVPVTESVSRFGSLAFSVPHVSSFRASGSLYTLAIAICGAIATALLIIPVSRVTPARVLGALGGFVAAVSGTFFFLKGESFPYTTRDFAEVWMRAELGLWIVVPLLFAITLAPLPFSVTATLMYTVTAVVYAFWFSVVRLSLLLAFFHFAGLVWFAPAYFLVGFLVDFTYVVAIYSLAVSKAAEEASTRREVWQW